MPASSGADDFASLTAAKERILPNRASRERPTAPSLSIPCAGSPACCTPPQRPVPVPAKVSELRRDHPATRMVVPRVQQRTNHLLHTLFVVTKDDSRTATEPSGTFSTRRIQRLREVLGAMEEVDHRRTLHRQCIQKGPVVLASLLRVVPGDEAIGPRAGCLDGLKWTGWGLRASNSADLEMASR